MSAAKRAALAAKVSPEALYSFNPMITPVCSFRPDPGATVADHLNESSNLLQASLLLSRLIVDGQKDDAELLASAQEFLLEASKALLDSAVSELGKGVQP